MRVRVGELWERLNTGYWFVPSVMAVAGIGLAFGTIALDRAVTSELVDRLDWVYRGGPEGAAGVLTAVAGSMITIAGLVFSLTLVALTLASSQFGPRLLRNFIRDRVTQFVMGTFLAAFLYCLFVLRTIRRDDGDEFVPHVSVTIGVVFAVAGLVMLVYFIHHLATSIQADTLIARVSDDLATGIDRLYPEEIGNGGPAEPAASSPAGVPGTVPAGGDGYVQFVEPDRVLAAACRCDVVVELIQRPGHYVLAGAPLARVWPAERLTEELTRDIDRAIVRGAARTPHQDIEFVINQLVEIALRALSPGINDPFTAITCIDRIASGLARLARRKPPSPYRLDESGKLRVIGHPVRFPEALDAAFNQIRQYGRSSAAILIRMLEVVADLASVVQRTDGRAALRRHAEMIARAAHDALPEENDRKDVAERVLTLAEVLGVDASAA
jgi:uncharacterized membrane protein